MTLPADALVGSQQPRHSWAPPFLTSTGNEATELAALAGLELDPWQQWFLTQALGERPNGKWASFGVGLIVPRQNGKGGLLEARELAGLFLLGERLIIHSAHEVPTAEEAFLRLAELIESTPSLSKRLAKNRTHGIQRGNGKVSIRLASGQRIVFRTRTKGGGRGFTADCLILDEAYELPDTFMSATVPTLSARPNPQVWYTSSAVDQTVHENGLVLARVRERGLAHNDPSLCFAEWAAADSLADVTTEMLTDPASWAAANPALGIRISPEYIANERREFASNTRGFAVERLGAGDWPDVSAERRIIPQSTWDACRDDRRYPQGPVCFAYDIAPDLSSGSISVAGVRADGLVYVEVLDQGPGTLWMVPRIAELKKTQRNRGIWCDAAGPAGSLLAEFKALGIEVEVVGIAEHGRACGAFYTAVRDHQLRHRETAALEAAVAGAARRTVGDVWLWDRKSSSVDISPLVSSTLAAWAAQANRKKAPRAVNLSAALAKDALVTSGR